VNGGGRSEDKNAKKPRRIDLGEEVRQRKRRERSVNHVSVEYGRGLLGLWSYMKTQDSEYPIDRQIEKLEK
jgi:hypothetical protein